MKVVLASAKLYYLEAGVSMNASMQRLFPVYFIHRPSSPLT